MDLHIEIWGQLLLRAFILLMETALRIGSHVLIIFRQFLLLRSWFGAPDRSIGRADLNFRLFYNPPKAQRRDSEAAEF